MGSRQQKDNSPPQGPHDPPSQDPNLPFGCTTSSDPAMNTINPFLPSPADTVVDMPRDGHGHGTHHHDGDLLAPTPGQSLFSEFDQDVFRGFFQLITDPTPEIDYGEGLNFSDQWVNHYQPPQTVIGHQTHPSNTSMESILSTLSPIGFENFIPDFGSSMPQQLSPDVLGAAHVLSRPSVPSNHQHQHQQHHYNLPHGLPQPPTSMGPPMNTIQNHQYPHFSSGNANVNSQRHAATVHQLLGNGYTDMYHSVAPPLPPNSRPAPPPEINFGSDTGFTGSNFTTHTGETNIEKRVFDRQNSILDCLEPNTSAAPTRASSPQHNGGGGSGGGNGNGNGGGETPTPLKLKTRPFTVPSLDPDNSNQPPRKRRKSRPKMSPDEDEPAEFGHFEAMARTPGRAARGSTGSIPRTRLLDESSPIEEPPSAGGRRRRGGGPAPKPPRENLTEAQKRENHIKSEQKRRTLIKDGFDDLQEIVPGLKGSGLSKSVILGSAGNYLDKVMAGNSVLAKKLGRAC